ncbi:DedA family protein [Mycobacterium sp. DL592]|uniref:DedA family protein n=1 Tax=Mycobacterium sp. DL592 TaxID=2675524 RepID=UPI00141EC87E|nr:VTT domain-containing protein [Mycobacterium sp. DL592]
MFPLDHLPQLPSGPLFYLILLAVVVGSSVPVVSVVVAAEPVLMAVLLLPADGHLSIPAMLAVTVGGAVLGDVLAYLLGRNLGPKLLGNKFVRRSRKHVHGAHRRVQRRGVLGALVAQRWVPPARGFVPALLGTARHPFGPFVISSAVAATLWAVVVIVGIHLGGPTLVVAIPAVMTAVMAIQLARRFVARIRPPAAAG